MKTYEIFSNDNYHDYTLRVLSVSGGGHQLALYASNGEHWSDSMKNSLLMKITNTGDEIIFGKPLKRKLQYEEVEYLRIILHIENLIKYPNQEYKNKIMSSGEKDFYI